LPGLYPSCGGCLNFQQALAFFAHMRQTTSLEI
jgi:hypothetical protein